MIYYLVIMLRKRFMSSLLRLKLYDIGAIPEEIVKVSMPIALKRNGYSIRK
jgi:hypothetical protein